MSLIKGLFVFADCAQMFLLQNFERNATLQCSCKKAARVDLWRHKRHQHETRGCTINLLNSFYTCPFTGMLSNLSQRLFRLS